MPTGIQWTDETINPIAAFDRETGKRGWFCVHASPGCVNCYAESFNGFRGNGQSYRLPNADKVEIRLLDHILQQPEGWRRPKKIFVCSMTDLFLALHTDQMIDRVVTMMARNRRHTFQVLTKRADRLREYSTRLAAMTRQQGGVRMARSGLAGTPAERLVSDDMPGGMDWPLPNVWLGVSVENQRFADERIESLVDTPAAVRWLSVEPLIEHVILWRATSDPTLGPPARFVDWVVVGGESGPRARPFGLDWARAIVEQCREAGVAPFVKQLGRNPIGVKLKDRHGGDWDEWPQDLRVREFPRQPVRVA
jgi:protein gp37